MLISHLAIPINEEEAAHLCDAIADPVTQNLVGAGLGGAFARFITRLTDDGEQIPRRLPAESFDMAFHVAILRELFSKRDLIERILAGEQVAAEPVVSSPLVLNDEAAERVRESVVEPVSRNLLTAALNEARRRIAAAKTATERSPSTKPPSLPFDLEFFATVMETYFSMVWMIENLLKGQSIEQAGGWE